MPKDWVTNGGVTLTLSAKRGNGWSRRELGEGDFGVGPHHV
jgi:hypothetical protein